MMEQRWLSTYRAPVPDYGLARLCGCGYWKSVFGACVPDPELDGQFGLPLTHAFFLYGAEGNGKRTLAGALAADLAEAGYLFAWVPGADLTGETESETAEQVTALLGEIPGAVAAGITGVCLLIEDFQLLLEDKKVARALEQGLERLMNRQVPCVILGVAESREHFPARLEKLMLPCFIGLPDEKERREYLEQSMEGYLPHEHGLSYKKMAEMTDGFNYDRLDKLTRLAAMLLKYRARFLFGKDRGQMKEALRQGMVVITEEMFQQMTDHLSRQAEAGQGWQAEAASLPAMQRNHMPAAGTAGGPGGMGAGWGGAPQADPRAAGLDAMVSKIETELGQGRSMMDMMDDLDLDAL